MLRDANFPLFKIPQQWSYTIPVFPILLVSGRTLFHCGEGRRMCGHEHRPEQSSQISCSVIIVWASPCEDVSIPNEWMDASILFLSIPKLTLWWLKSETNFKMKKSFYSHQWNMKLWNTSLLKPSVFVVWRRFSLATMSRTTTPNISQFFSTSSN